MSLAPEVVEALRRAAATRPDIARVELVEQHVEPRSEPAFTDRRLVVVLEQPPTESPGLPVMRALVELLGPALHGDVPCSITVPAAHAVECMPGERTTLYEREQRA